MNKAFDMKTSASILTYVVALSLVAGTFLRGQNPEDPASLPAVQETLERVQTETKQAQDRVQQEFGVAQQQSQTARQQLQRAQKQLAQIEPAASPRAVYADRLQNIIRRAPGGSVKALVIRSAETDPKGQANLEEDLAVMSHVFDKAMEEKLGPDRHARNAMGINVFFAPGSGQLRNLYLEGYGALFLLNVGFPLLPPPPRPEPQKEKTPVDSAWQEAKDELYGQHPVGKTVSGPVEEYNEEKVNKLKDAVLEALKNASNIRNLKADDTITVCVFGGASASAVKPNSGVKPAPAPGAEPFNEDRTFHFENSAPMRSSILTIRVKKSDVDAFAKGKLNIDEFRKKARSATYATDLGGGSGNFSFSFSGGDGVFDVPSRTLRTPDQFPQPRSPHGSGGGSGGSGELP